MTDGIEENNHLGIYHGRDRAALVDAKATSGIESATRNDSGGISGGYHIQVHQ